MQKKYQMTHILHCLIVFLLLYASDVMAFSREEMIDDEAEALMEEWKPLAVTGDAIPWDIFASTKEIDHCTVDKEGFDYCLIKPGYSKNIKQYDEIEVTMMGFMFPLEQSEKQQNFLIGPYPLSCPFHYHVGPSQIVEVFAKEPLEFSYDLITIKGTLFLHFNEETGVFYYLKNARIDATPTLVSNSP